MRETSRAAAASIHDPLSPLTKPDVHPDVSLQSIIATNSRKEILRTSRTTAETWSIGEDASVGTVFSDSGYGSNGSAFHEPREDSISVFELHKRKLFRRKVTKLKHFDMQIPQPIHTRFEDLTELFSKPLYDYLHKAGVEFSAISIKLKSLGESEETAKPWIVVLCDKAAQKKVKQFFDQKQVKLQYKPHSHFTDMALPSFEILYYSRPPRQIAATDAIYGEAWGDIATSVTLCGKVIKAGELEATRVATLGGIIKVVTSAESFTLYGMTAGHIIARNRLEEDNGKESDGGESDGEEETFELDLTPEENQEACPTRDLPSDVGHSAHLWSEIGVVSDASRHCYTENCNRDWALVRIYDPSFYRPNLLVARNTSQLNHTKKQLREPSGELIPTGPDRDVFVMSGISGFKRGRLSSSPSFLMLAPGKSFTKTHDLALYGGSELKSGDSGSWVVDALTYEVYGHIVASDAFGEAYVIPLLASLREMKKQLGVKSVSLPSGYEVCDWLQHHGGTCPISLFSATSADLIPAIIQEGAHETHEARKTQEYHTCGWCRLLNPEDPACVKTTYADQPDEDPRDEDSLGEDPWDENPFGDEDSMDEDSQHQNTLDEDIRNEDQDTKSLPETKRKSARAKGRQTRMALASLLGRLATRSRFDWVQSIKQKNRRRRNWADDIPSKDEHVMKLDSSPPTYDDHAISLHPPFLSLHPSLFQPFLLIDRDIDDFSKPSRDYHESSYSKPSQDYLGLGYSKLWDNHDQDFMSKDPHQPVTALRQA